MKKFVDFTTKKIERLKEKTSILASISGGQDSCVTFLLCLHLEKLAGLEVVYCNHFWQPKNFVSSGLIFRLSFLFDVPYALILPQNGVLGENQSRGWRKKSFYRLSYLEKILFTVTGHNRTDTFEKNLTNLFRGTSPKGLAESTLLTPKKSSGLFFYTQSFKPTTLRVGQFLFLRHPAQQRERLSHSKKKESQLKTTKLKDKFHFAKPLQQPICVTESKNNFFSTKVLKKGHRKQISLFFKRTSSFSFCICGKQYTKQPNCLKPLENVSRSTASKFLCLYEFPIITDVTNFSSSFSRNKIRHNVGPFIEAFLNKKIDDRVAQFFKTLNQEHYEVQKDLFALYYLALLAKSESTEKIKTKNKSCLQTFLSEMLPQFEGIALENSLLHKFFADYKDIELSFLQIRALQFLTLSKNGVYLVPPQCIGGKKGNG